MPSADYYTFFPAYAVFIGANMGLGAYIHFSYLTSLTYTLLRHFMIYLLVFAALFAILGSHTIADLKSLVKLSIWLLLVAYILMIILFTTGPQLDPDEKVVKDNLSDQNLESSDNDHECS